MKLIRFGIPGKERPGILDAAGKRRSVARFFKDFDERFFETDGLSRLQHLLENRADLPIVPEKVRWAAPLGRPSKIVCIGLNYARHAAESGMSIPTEPVVFFKSTTAICGPNDALILPKNSQKTDWEVELAFMIGKKASYVSEAEAMDYLAGYLLHNDYSEREFQMERSGQWVKGKSCDSFAPLGPTLVTKDEIPDPHNLPLWLTVNGERLQDSNTNDMVYKIPFLIHYLSQFMTLLPGDVVSTGTPFGVGLGFSPPRYLKAGDVVELGIEGLGVQRQVAVNYSGLSSAP
jgi:2-keto-4-pentenoate hydratase/2-oxohepta-3-ene-1,7-dioic acid hydratase in catechol pathway